MQLPKREISFVIGIQVVYIKKETTFYIFLLPYSIYITKNAFR